MAKREDGTGEHSFDELSREVADGTLSRGGALKSVGAAILGAALSMFAFPQDAEAAKLKILWAVVKADGALLQGKGVTSVSNFATGQYVVEFQRDVSNCAWSATLLNNSGFIYSDTILSFPNGPRLATPPEVGITTLDRGGFVRDTSFHLVVNC